MASHFSDRLCKAVKGKSTILTVGLDPVYTRLPAGIRKDQQAEPKDVSAATEAIYQFCKKTLRIVGPMVPAVKINIAYFERYLWEGIECFYSLLDEARALGVEIIGDVKRGDIGHTAENYAKAHLQDPQLAGLEDVITPDAITINGFAGADGIIPFADVATENGKGIFVWVRASNPSAAAIQDFADETGTKMYEKLAEAVGQIANQKKHIGSGGYSSVGMVVGGTSPEATTALRQKYPKMWILVPGYGSQGATAADCVRFCNADGLGGLVNSSRSIIYAFDKPKYKEQFGDNWEKCIEQAVIDAKLELSRAMQ